MKIPLQIIPLLLLLALSASAQTNALFIGPPANTAVLQWSYPSAEISSNLAFNVYTSPALTIPHTNWQVLTQFNSTLTNLFVSINGTNTYQVRVPVWYGAQFYAATATDSFWGESFFSNAAWTNPLPRVDNPLRIGR